jgi:hypothetical protein
VEELLDDQKGCLQGNKNIFCWFIIHNFLAF